MPLSVGDVMGEAQLRLCAHPSGWEVFCLQNTGKKGNCHYPFVDSVLCGYSLPVFWSLASVMELTVSSLNPAPDLRTLGCQGPAVFVLTLETETAFFFLRSEEAVAG